MKPSFYAPKPSSRFLVAAGMLPRMFQWTPLQPQCEHLAGPMRGSSDKTCITKGSYWTGDGPALVENSANFRVSHIGDHDVSRGMHTMHLRLFMEKLRPGPCCSPSLLTLRKQPRSAGVSSPALTDSVWFNSSSIHS